MKLSKEEVRAGLSKLKCDLHPSSNALDVVVITGSDPEIKVEGELKKACCMGFYVQITQYLSRIGK